MAVRLWRIQRQFKNEMERRVDMLLHLDKFEDGEKFFKKLILDFKYFQEQCKLGKETYHRRNKNSVPNTSLSFRDIQTRRTPNGVEPFEAKKRRKKNE